MRISDWSSDVCSSDLHAPLAIIAERTGRCLQFGVIADRNDGPRTGAPLAIVGRPVGAAPAFLHDRNEAVAPVKTSRNGNITGPDIENGRASCRERGGQYVKITVVGG